jgi:hypothetical protein
MKKGIPSIQKAGSTGVPKFKGLPRVQTQYVGHNSSQKFVKAMNKRMSSTHRSQGR